MANWPRVDPNDLGDAPAYARAEPRRSGFTYEPGSTFKAFTVAGALQDGAGHARHAASTCRRRSRSPTATIGDAEPRGTETLTTAQILAQSSNVGAVTIGLRAGRRALRPAGSTASASASRPASTARRGAGIVLPLDELLGLDDGQPADRPGPRGDADADGRRPTRRSPTAASCARRADRRRVGGKRVPRADGHRVISPQDRRRSCATMLEGVLAPGRHRLRGQRPRLHAGRQDRHRAEVAENGSYSKTKYVASFVGFAPGPATRSCWSRWSSTSRRARSTAARSRRRRSARSPAFALPVPAASRRE